MHNVFNPPTLIRKSSPNTFHFFVCFVGKQFAFVRPLRVSKEEKAQSPVVTMLGQDENGYSFLLFVIDGISRND